MGCHLWGRTELDTSEATYQQQQQLWLIVSPGLLLWPQIRVLSLGPLAQVSARTPATFSLCSPRWREALFRSCPLPWPRQGQSVHTIRSSTAPSVLMPQDSGLFTLKMQIHHLHVSFLQLLALKSLHCLSRMCRAVTIYIWTPNLQSLLPLLHPLYPRRFSEEGALCIAVTLPWASVC